VTPEENIAYWRHVRDRASRGAAAAAEAMARYIAERTARDTLQRSSHAAGQYYKAEDGAPPASASGTLAGSMRYSRGSGALRARARVWNDAPHAKLLEWGCVVEPSQGAVMHWVDSGGSWYHARLVVDAHPFLGPTLDEAVRDGGLRDAALEGFRPYDP